MENRLLWMFQKQVVLQCQFLLFARDELVSGLKQQDMERIFYALQNILTAAANIAKALWGGGGKRGDERSELRASIGVLDDSPLKTVTMRNNFEHFDERLDRWWRESPKHSAADMNLCRPGIVGFAEIDWFRNYDPPTGILSFFGEEFNIPEIVREAVKIHPRLTEELKKGPWGEAMPE